MEPLFKMYLKPSETLRRNHSIFVFSVPWGSDSFSLEGRFAFENSPKSVRVKDGECDENKLGRMILAKTRCNYRNAVHLLVWLTLGP